MSLVLAYLARVSTAGADYGLVAGRTQLGKRNKRAADEFLSRVWLLPDVPSSFSPDQVQELLQQNFEDVELIRQRRRRAWFVDLSTCVLRFEKVCPKNAFVCSSKHSLHFSFMPCQPACSCMIADHESHLLPPRIKPCGEMHLAFDFIPR